MKSLKLYIRSYALFLLIIFFLTLPAFLPIIHNGFFPTQDYVYIPRLAEMNKALEEGDFPVRWAGHLRYGEPLFNFYAPLPYYIGSLIKFTFGLFGLNLTVIVLSKILLILAFILSAWAMFFLSAQFFGKVGGLLSAVLYTFAPYHSVDVYVRGAMGEHWALIFFPLIFLFFYRLSQRFSWLNMLLTALSLAALFFTHNVMTLIFMPFVLAWVLFLAWQKRNLKFLFFGGLSAVWAFGLAASFLLPALLERQFIQTSFLTSDYFNFRAHFVELHQLFSTFWGYGPSVWGPNDGLSFQIGLIHWLVLGFSITTITASKFLKVSFNELLRSKLLSIPAGKFLFEPFILAASCEVFWFNNKTLSTQKINIYFWLTLFLNLSFWFSLFMMHNKSTPIWEASPLLAFVQFPWRFLGISIFLVSFLGGVIGAASGKSKVNYLRGIIILLIIATIAINFNYFKPERYLDESFFNNLFSADKLVEGNDLPKDYLPIWVKSFRKGKLTAAHFVQGAGTISLVTKKNSQLSIRVDSGQGGIVEAPITYFPGWQAQINGQIAKILNPDDYGLIRFKVPAGQTQVELKFTDTPVRKISNLISLFSLALVPLLVATMGVAVLKKR